MRLSALLILGIHLTFAGESFILDILYINTILYNILILLRDVGQCHSSFFLKYKIIHFYVQFHLVPVFIDYFEELLRIFFFIGYFYCKNNNFDYVLSFELNCYESVSVGKKKRKKKTIFEEIEIPKSCFTS